jgi:WD40 repeat protein
MSNRFTRPSARSWVAAARAWFAILAIPVIAAAQQTVLPGPASAVGQGETAVEPIDFEGPGQKIVAPTRIAWCSALSPDETWLATCYGVYQGDVGRLRVWDLKTGKVKWEAREDRGIRRVAISPDGSLVASGNWEGEIHFRDAVTGDLRRSLANTGGSIECISFSSDGRSLVSCGNRRTLRIWDVATGQVLKKFEGHTNVASLVDSLGDANTLAWSPDGTLLATGSADNSVRLWNVITRKEVALLEGHKAAVLSVAFTPDGRRLVSGSGDATANVWDVGQQTLIKTLAGHAGAVRAVAISPDGTTIVTAGDETSVRLWDATTLQPRAVLKGHQNAVASLAFSPQGRTLASGGMGGGVLLWDARRGVSRKTLNGHTESVTALGFLPDGSGLIGGSADQTIRLWRAGATRVPALVSLPAHPPLAFAVEFSPDGKWLASGGRDNVVALRDPATGAVRRTLTGHRGLIYDVAFSPDSTRVASASADGTVKLWSVDPGMQLASYNAFGERFSNIRSVAYSPDGFEIASGSEDGTIKLWNVNDRKVRHTLTGQALPVLCVNYSPDGSLLATSTGFNQQTQVPGELRLWDTKSGKEIASLEGHSTEIKRVVFDAAGRRMASVGSDRSVLIWNVADRTVETTFRADAAVTSIVFLADRDLLAIGDNRGGVAIYSVAQGAAVRRYAGHEKLVPGIAVRPDQKVLATASHDGTVKLWPAPVMIDKSQ